MRFQKIILILIACFGNLYLAAQDSLQVVQAEKLKGSVYDPVNKRRVPFAHIINQKKSLGTIGDTIGNFSIQADSGDVLFISAMGYQFDIQHVTAEMMDSQEGIEIQLVPRAYMLPEVVIYELNTYTKFKKKFMEVEIEDDRYVVPGLPDVRPGRIPALLDTNVIRHPLFAIIHPISFFYYNFNKRQKNLRLYLKLLDRDRLKALAAIRYNKEVINSITGLEGEDLDDFIDFCKIPPEYVIRTNDYNLYILTLKLLEEYRDSMAQ